MLLAPKESIAECVEKINPQYFHNPINRELYEILVELWESGKEIELVTFTQILRDRKRLDAIGGAVFVTSLFTFVPTAANLPYYLEIVTDKYVLREVISVCTEGVRRAHEEQHDVTSLLSDVQSKILAVIPEKSPPKTINDFTSEAVDQIEQLYGSKGEIIGLKTGVTDLDRKLRGFKPGELVIIAGPTGMGKTSLSMNIAEYNAIKEGLGVCILSLEMGGVELTQRLVQSHSRLNIEGEAQKSTRESTIPKLMKSIDAINNAPFHIRDDSDMTALQARGIVRKLAHENKIALVVADYAQLFLSDSKRDDTKATELSEVAKAFKRMAKELQLVVILISQLNDQGQLFDSRAMGHHSDKVLHIRPAGDKTYIDIKKNRNGERGSVEVCFLAPLTRFENIARL